MLGENTAIELQKISKTFKSYQPDTQTDSAKTLNETPTLKNINFQLAKGEVLGIIGNNGAGKSTLLKVISELIKPDTGSVTYRGKLSSILDIGSGFHPDLTGLDNVYMVARLIGYSNREIDKILEEIIDFSGLRPFMQMQVKHYSSGMFMRLAFSLLTTLQSDILLIDEVLSVGDMNFREKSSARIKEIAAKGVTIIIASHEMRTIENLCSHGLWLHGGKQKGFDTIRSIIDKYVEHDPLTSVNYTPFLQSKNGSTTTEIVRIKDGITPTLFYADKERVKNENVKVTLVQAFVKAKEKPTEADISMDDVIEIGFEYEKQMAIPLILSAVIADKFGNSLISLCAYRVADQEEFVDTTPAGRYVHSVKLPKGLLNEGIFSISFYLADNTNHDTASYERLLHFKVHSNTLKVGSFNYPTNYSCPLFPMANWQTIKTL